MEEPRIKNVGWSLGNYCNAKCQHCYSWRVRQSEGILSKNDIDTIIHKLSILGVETLNLGGNEPIYTDGSDTRKTTLPYMLEEIVKKNIDVGVTTNGITAVVLHRDYNEAFKLVNDWDISLDSPFKEEHNKNRGGNLFDLAIKALEIISEYGTPKSIITCGMSWNLDRQHLDGFLEIAKKYDAEFRINTLKPIETHHFNQLPTPKQYFEVFKYLIDRTDQVVMGESILAALTGHSVYGCPCGTSSMRIHSKTPDGRVPVSPCVYLHNYKVGDMIKDDVFDIVNSSSFKEMRKHTREIPDACREKNCSLINVCRGGCAARSVLINKNLCLRDPYCPIDASESGVIIPQFPKVVVGHEGTRVHENYLCTWIGKPK